MDDIKLVKKEELTRDNRGNSPKIRKSGKKLKSANRCFYKSDYMTLALLAVVTIIPLINVTTYGWFASENVIDWDTYYTDSDNSHLTSYVDKNQTSAGAFSYSFPPFRVCVPPDFFIYPNYCFEVEKGEFPFSVDIKVAENTTVKVNLLAGKLFGLAYDTNETADLHYTYEYKFERKTIYDVLFLTPIIVPFTVGYYPDNESGIWSNLDIYMYLRDGNSNLAKGWHFTNTSSETPKDYRRVAINTGTETFNADIYDVDISTPSAQAGTTKLPRVKPIDLDRILPFAIPEIEVLGIPFDIDLILNLFGIPGLEYLLFINDQLYGWHQWTTTASELGVSITVKSGIHGVNQTKYFGGIDYSLESFGYDFKFNASTFIPFLDLSMFCGKISPYEDAVFSIFLFDVLVVILWMSFVIFVNYYKFPGRKSQEELYEAFKLKYDTN